MNPPPPDPDDLENLLALASETARSPKPILNELLPRLEQVARLLRAAPVPTAYPALVFCDAEGTLRAQAIGTRLRVGRSDECEIRFPAIYRELSRRHFTITEEDGEYFVQDSSFNGTLVSGQPCRKDKRRLIDGDLIEAGGFHFVFLRQ